MWSLQSDIWGDGNGTWEWAILLSFINHAFHTELTVPSGCSSMPYVLDNTKGLHHICIPTVVSSPFLLSLRPVPWKDSWLLMNTHFSFLHDALSLSLSTSVSATVCQNTKCNSRRLTVGWAKQDTCRTPATLDGGTEQTQKELEDTSDVVYRSVGSLMSHTYSTGQE